MIDNYSRTAPSSAGGVNGGRYHVTSVTMGDLSKSGSGGAKASSGKHGWL